MATKMPLKTMAPMIPSREHGGGNDQERRTREDGHHDKQVVDRQHFLQRITRYKQAGNLSTVVDVEKPANAIATTTQNTDQSAALFREMGLSSRCINRSIKMAPTESAMKTMTVSVGKPMCVETIFYP